MKLTQKQLRSLIESVLSETIGTTLRDPDSGSRYHLDVDFYPSGGRNNGGLVRVAFGRSFTLTLDSDGWADLNNVVQEAFSNGTQQPESMSAGAQARRSLGMYYPDKE